jgi:hypothetical protein
METSELFQLLLQCYNKLKDMPNQTERDLVLMAVKQNGLILEAIQDEKFLNDKEIIFEAIKNNPGAFQYLLDEQRNDIEFARQAFLVHPLTCAFFGSKLHENMQFMEWIIDTDLPMFHYLYAAQRNFNISLRVIKSNFDYISAVNITLRDNMNFMLEAVKINPQAIKHASVRLGDSPEFIVLAAIQDIQVLNHVQDNWLSNIEVITAIYRDTSEKKALMNMLHKDFITENALLFLKIDFEQCKVPSMSRYGGKWCDIVLNLFY